MIGASLPVKVGQLVGRALGSRILQTAILRGSMDYISQPDIEIPITEGFEVDISLDKQNLYTTAAISGGIFAASSLFFVKRVRYADRLFAAANMFSDMAASLTYIRQSFGVMESLVSDLDGGVLRGSTLESSVKFQLAQVNGELDKLETIIQLADALNNPASTRAEIDAIATRINILSDFNRTLSQNVREAYTLINDTSLDPDLQRQFRLLFGSDALGLSMVIEDIRDQTRDLNDIIRTQVRPAIEATELSADEVRRRVLQGDLTIMRPRAADRALQEAVENAVIMTGSALDEADNLATASKLADNLAGGKTKLTKTAKFVGRGLGKLLLFDTVIWGVTGGIDLGLNLFLDEEDQGFFSKYVGGYSPVGEAFTWGASKIWDIFVDPETQQTIGEIFVSTLILAANSDDVEGVLGTIMQFFVDDVSPDIDVILDFSVDQTIQVSPTGLFSNFDVEDILLGFYIAIVAKLVYTYWVRPAIAGLGNYL